MKTEDLSAVALADNESAVRELSGETLKKIAHELTDNLRKNLPVDWSKRESVRATLRLMVRRILRKHKCPARSAGRGGGTGVAAG